MHMNVTPKTRFLAPIRVEGLSTLAITAVIGVSFGLLAPVTGCASKTDDIRVASEAKPYTDLTKLRTYSWSAAAAVVRDPNHKWTPSSLDVGSEIKFARGLRGGRGHGEP
jgi:hypothetical protein